ncbi:MAG TPA: FAD-binding protein [Acidimicrobiales bacterium]|jgi:electron transfer flavoprotein alpha subunit|nr:FAD-binding protein [Acidimicrobiales bacterium]
MRIAILVKQVPKFEAMELGPGGRLVREGLELELNPYCRRAVSKGVELAGATGGTSTVFTLGPPPAEDVLREAIAWGVDDGVLITDSAFAGSDTLATARALAAGLAREGPFDLVLVGRNSVDADTGQVGPEIAELLDLPFVTGVRQLDLGEGQLRVVCEEDDGRSERIVQLPAIASTAERLCEPAKVDPAGRAAVPADRIRVLRAADLGDGPWGEDGSGTYVGEVRVLEIARAHRRLSGPIEQQVEDAVGLLRDRGALDAPPRATRVHRHPSAHVSMHERSRGTGGAVVAVAVEPGRDRVTAELLGAAVALADEIDGHAVALESTAAAVEEDVARALIEWASASQPWAILLPSTTWGREVGGRGAARLEAGLTGDAVALEVSRTATSGAQRLLAWKPAFGGRLVAAIYCSSAIQMATVRAGVLPAPPGVPDVERIVLPAEPRGRVDILSSTRDDDIEALAVAQRVVCVGVGVNPDEYSVIQPLLAVLDAQLAATRKVTDKGWLPRARQVGITGRSIAPQLYIGIGLSGKFNHAVGVRAAGTVLAVNNDPDAPIWDHADIGIVGEWREVVPLLTAQLAEAM